MEQVIGLVVVLAVVGYVVYKQKPEWVEYVLSDFKKKMTTSSSVGKGSKPRPITISKKQYQKNWDRIFKKGKRKDASRWKL